MSGGGQARQQVLRQDFGVTLGLLLTLLLWEGAGLDLPVARQFGTAEGFTWRNHDLLRTWLHEGGRSLAWLVLGTWSAWALWPRRQPLLRRRHLVWIGAALAAAAGIALLKRFSTTSCPWDLNVFGGVAAYVPHWQWGVADGGPGRCFPSGHASAGSALLALYFALRWDRPAQARAALGLILVTWLIFGAVQVVRGAHYPSHVMWSGFLCWSSFVFLDVTLLRRALKRAALGPFAQNPRL